MHIMANTHVRSLSSPIISREYVINAFLTSFRLARSTQERHVQFASHSIRLTCTERVMDPRRRPKAERSSYITFGIGRVF